MKVQLRKPSPAGAGNYPLSADRRHSQDGDKTQGRPYSTKTRDSTRPQDFIHENRMKKKSRHSKKEFGQPNSRPSDDRYYGKYSTHNRYQEAPYMGSEDPYHSHSYSDSLPRPNKQRRKDYQESYPNNQRETQEWSSHSRHGIHHRKRNREDIVESTTYRRNHYESDREVFPSDRNYYSS